MDRIKGKLWGYWEGETHPTKPSYHYDSRSIWIINKMSGKDMHMQDLLNRLQTAGDVLRQLMVRL
jgi:hypothetical protein